MRKILSSPIFRAFLCAVLICALLINVSPIKAKADAITGAAIVKASTVTCNPYIICAAILIACGVYAGTKTDAFENLVSNCVDAMEAAGTWIKNGVVEMYRVVTDTGEVEYYADTAMMESVRTWLFDSDTVYASSEMAGFLDAKFSSALATLSEHDYWFVAFNVNGYVCGYGTYTLEVVPDPSDPSLVCLYGASRAFNGYSWYSTNAQLFGPFLAASVYVKGEVLPGAFTLLDLALGHVSTVPIDGTSARTWSETYANRGLYIASGGNQGDPDDGAEGNDGWKFLLPLSLASAAILAAMSQAEQWTGTTPPEFDDYTEKEELTVAPAPEFDGYPAIEISPVTNPNPDPGTGTDPGTGANPGTGTNPDPGTNPDVDPNPGTNTGTGSWTPPSDMGKFTLDLKQYFPFCIPFDLYAFFTCLNAEPVAPVIEWIIPLPGGQTYPFEIDLSVFDPVAQILRRMQLLLFCVGLAFKTRDLIKG